MIRNVQTNPFRHKFTQVNREWIINNLALILGGRNYQANFGGEQAYLKNLYQAAINYEEAENKLNKKQIKL